MKNTQQKKTRGPKPEAHVHDEHCNHDHGGEHDDYSEFEMSIREYKPEDYRELKAIWKAGEIKTDATDSAKSLKENTQKRPNGFRVLVAEAKELDARSKKPIGAPRLAGGVIVTFDGHRAYIYHFAVHPDFRGVGLGRALIETCEQQAKAWGAMHLRLMSRTDAAREGARRLYETLGWSRVTNLCQYKKDL